MEQLFDPEWFDTSGGVVRVRQDKIAALFATGASKYFGDGRDGPQHITTDTVLTQDMRATTLLVDPGVRLDVAGYEITASDSIVNHGIIADDGVNGAADGSHGGTARSAACSCSVAGGQGGDRFNPGTQSINQFGASSTPEPVGASGGAGGGAGHGAGGTNAGYTVDPTIGSPFNGPAPTSFYLLVDSTGQFAAMTAGCGGGGAGVNGGTGGAGGGIVRIRSKSITNSATGIISAKGGNGSAGTASGGSGGGGGGGGRVIIVGDFTNNGQIVVSGGTGGAGNGAGVAGQNGSAGTVHLFT